MTHRHLTAAAALAACTALLLTGCGGDDGKSKDDDKIAGAEGSDAKSPSVNPSKSDSTSRPDINLPKDVKNVFEGWETGDPEKDAVLADVKRTVNALDDAIIRGDVNSSALTFYRIEEAAATASKWIQAWLDEDISFTGTTRYYDPKIEMDGKSAAGVVYCIDQSNAYNKSRTTGQVDKEPSDDSPYVLYNTRLKKSDQGVWQTTKVISKRGHAACS